MRVRIVARRAGFRRCGIAHPAQPVDHPAGRFTAAELERLQADPMLEVELLDDQPNAKAGAKAPAKAGK